MAAVDSGSQKVTPSPSIEHVKSFKEVFTPKDTLDQPCDVVLMVKEGKEFKANRKVLSEASLFFEKLLNSDMKESKEGIVRLEMFSESVMAATLEFIYTGHVQILAEDDARDLIIMADYLFLQELKTLAGEVLAQKLNTSNCISSYYFSQRYQCEELLSEIKKFILVNFTAVYAANREDVLNMSSKEVEMWISSDEINVSAEEDVFKIILAWINHDKNKRNKYFAELFRHVRLVYVSRDFLISDAVTNDLVKDNEGCLDLVKDATDLIDSNNFDKIAVPPRKSLESPAIVMRKGADILCYFPDNNSWCRLGEIPSEHNSFHSFFPFEGKLYCVKSQLSSPMESYNPYSNSWTRLPPLEKPRILRRIIGTNVKEIYALLSGENPVWNEHYFYISTYKPESHSWEDILSLNPQCYLKFYQRQNFCIVTSTRFIYFIGGISWYRREYLSDVDRYDLSTNQWDEVADIQVARGWAYGAAMNEKVFVVGGDHQGGWLPPACYQCEVYDERTNEWQFIASLKKPNGLNKLLVSDGRLYAVSCEIRSLAECDLQEISVECYNSERNEWEIKTKTPAFPVKRYFSTPTNACTMRIFKGLSNIRPLRETCASDSTSDSLSAATTTQATHENALYGAAVLE
ncbi:kelch-like protein 40 [Oculina patagonica]